MKTVLLARRAMNTRFEVWLHGPSEPTLRAAGEEALNEVELLEAQLSLFRPTSEIAQVNRYAAERPVRVSPPTFALLRRAWSLWSQTGGAFDPTVGPLLKAWGFLGGGGGMPAPSAVAQARGCVGMSRVVLDPENQTVRFERPGMLLDLGAIGKGYAIDCAVECLREAGVTSALIHAGTSSVYGLGRMPDGQPWKTAICGASAGVPSDPADRSDRSLLAEIPLVDAALGVSAVAGKAFRWGDQCFGHVLDPRTGEPSQSALLAAVSLPAATEADALSTALLVQGEAGLDPLAAAYPGARALLQFLPVGLHNRTCIITRGVVAVPPGLLEDGGGWDSSTEKP